MEHFKANYERESQSIRENYGNRHLQPNMGTNYYVSSRYSQESSEPREREGMRNYFEGNLSYY